jgi:hypothetical protein
MYVRIRSYKRDDHSLCAEHLYIKKGTQCDAIAEFKKDMPEQKGCIIIAEDYDSQDPDNAEHFKACRDCGCVHFF